MAAKKATKKTKGLKKPKKLTATKPLRMGVPDNHNETLLRAQ